MKEVRTFNLLVRIKVLTYGERLKEVLNSVRQME
jgi:hypothetical protein